MPKPSKEETLQAMRECAPFIRSGIALLIYLTRPMRSVHDCYGNADEFVKQLVSDVEAQA